MAQPVRPHMAITGRMLSACWVTTATETNIQNM